MRLEISFDDGLEQDTQIIDILNKYGFTATFYVPILSWGFDHIGVYSGHKIGGHTITHPSDLKLLSEIDQRREISDCKRLLETVIGNAIESFCYPRGRYSDETVSCVVDAGYKEARTTIVGQVSVADLYRKGTTVHVFQRKEYGGQSWYDYAISILQKQPEYFHLWGHSKEIIDNGNLLGVDKLLRYIKESVLYEN